MKSQWDAARTAANELSAADLELLLRKAKDYSTNNIHAVGAEGVASRLVDKVHRLHTLLSSGADPAVDETIEDTLGDIRNYCTILALKRAGRWPRMIRSVYVAGPIDDVKEQTPLLAVFEMLINRGLTVYSPRDAFCNGKATPDFVAAVNRAVLVQCDAVLVYWPDPIPSFGTGRDVEYARSNGKRVFVIAPWCTSTERHDCEVYATVKEAAEAMAP